MPKHITVVYTINDERAFEAEHHRIMEHMQADTNQPWAITAITRDHEIRRLELIEKALDKNDFPHAHELISKNNVGNHRG